VYQEKMGDQEEMGDGRWEPKRIPWVEEQREFGP